MPGRRTDKTAAPQGDKKNVIVYLSPELHKRFKRWCEDQDRSMSDMIRENIQSLTDNYEERTG